MDAPDRHDTMVEATALAQSNEYESYHQGVVICSYLIVAVVACIAARDVAVQRAAHTGGVSPDLVGAAAGKDGVSRFALGCGRLFWLLFGVFFVTYHLCYENILHHTDGMEYLSDWTIVLLCFVTGLLGWHSLAEDPSASVPGWVTELAVIAHGVAWSSNIMATIGAWYSFFFYPICETLEGVNNWPWCYLEWYRLAEHGLNMLVLLGDWRWGCVPLRRKDLGWSVIFLETYAMWAWLIMFNTGRCPYDMFDFGTGWTEVPWLCAALAGIAACHMAARWMYAARDRDAGRDPEGGENDALPVNPGAKYESL